LLPADALVAQGFVLGGGEVELRELPNDGVDGLLSSPPIGGEVGA
jgi:hypothetical protein